MKTPKEKAIELLPVGGGQYSKKKTKIKTLWTGTRNEAKQNMYNPYTWVESINSNF